MNTNNKWSYKGNIFTLNDIEHEFENVVADELSIGDNVVVSNGWRVEGIGKLLRISYSSYDDCLYVETKINGMDYSFYLECKQNVARILKNTK